MKRKLILLFLALVTTASAALATVSTISGFTNQADGNTVDAALWNSQIGGIYTYINSNLVNVFNLLTDKGDFLTYTGAAHARFTTGGAANDGKFLMADSTQANGWNLGSPTNVANLTAKGDLLTFDGSSNQRLPVGTDGYILTARSSAGNGMAWEANSSAIPSGLIAMWSGNISDIPTGWALCDGQSHSGTTPPNLQGLFIVGAGNASPAATGGMGLMNPGGPFGDASAGAGLGPSHNHSVSSTSTVITASGSGSSVSVVTSVGAASTKTITPKYYALAFIMKL